MSMDTAPLQDIEKHCKRCSVPDLFEQDKLSLGDSRRTCANCRLSVYGIYKFDAIHEVIHMKKEQKANLTPGRKATREKVYGETIRNLHRGSFSNNKIAEIIGISHNTEKKIVDKMDNN